MPPKRGAVAGAGRHADDRRGHEAADHRGERGVLAGDHDHAVRAPRSSSAGASRCSPATPASSCTTTCVPSSSARTRASVTTGPSEVPPETIVTMPARLRRPPRHPREPRPGVLLGLGRDPPHAPPAPASSARVTSTLPGAALEQGARDRLDLLGRSCPRRGSASGAPWRSSRCVSTRAKPRSRNGCMGSASDTTGSVRCRHAAPAGHPDARAQVARRALALRARRRRGRAARALVGAVRWPAPARCPCRRATTTSSPTPRCATTWATRGTRRSVRVPARWAGERIVLRFDAATHRAVVWVDDTQVVEHEGGYTPFEADVTDVVEPGAEHRVTVVVNNVLTWQSIPPGVVDDTPDGPRQRYFHDFFNYAGLHRSVWLYTTPAVVRQGRDRRHRPGRLDRHRRLHGRDGGRRRSRSASRCATPTAPRSRAPPAPRARSRSRTSSRGGPARATCTTSTSSCGGRRRAGRRLLAGRRHPHRGGGRHALPHQRRAVLLQGLREARGQRRARQGPRQRVHGPRLRADGMARRQLVPHLALPLRRGGPRLCRPPRRRRDRRDRGGRHQHGPGRRRLRRPGRADVLRRDHQRRDAGRAPPGDPRARRARQEPPVRRAVEHRQRARVRHARRARVLRAARRGGAAAATRRGRSAS